MAKKKVKRVAKKGSKSKAKKVAKAKKRAKDAKALARTMSPSALKDLSDPVATMKIIEGAIAGRADVDREMARDAVEKVYTQHENQLRVFLIAAAKAKLSRVIKSTEYLGTVEEELLTEAKLKEIKPGDLIRLYAIINSSVIHDLDFIKRVADTNLEIQKVLGIVGANLAVDEKISVVLEDVPEQTDRSHIRQIVEKCLRIIKDESDVVDAPKPKRRSRSRKKDPS